MSAPRPPSPHKPVYFVHVAHVRDGRSPRHRDPQPDNHIGPPGDDPPQYGELYMHVCRVHDLPPTCKYDCHEADDFVGRKNWETSVLFYTWNGTAVEGFPESPRSDEGNEDAAFHFEERFYVQVTDESVRVWEGSIAQLDYTCDPWDGVRLLEEWVRAALIEGTAPQKRPGKTQPARQPDWDDPWWDA